MIDENRFRALCRKDQGGIEGAKFQEGLDESEADPVPVRFETGLEEFKIIEISREDAETYARIAKEERKPEEDLIEYIKPEAHMWVRHNRSKLIEKLKESMLQSSEGKPIVLVWPLWTPDSVPYDVALAYLRKYA